MSALKDKLASQKSNSLGREYRKSTINPEINTKIDQEGDIVPIL